VFGKEHWTVKETRVFFPNQCCVIVVNGQIFGGGVLIRRRHEDKVWFVPNTHCKEVGKEFQQRKHLPVVFLF